MKAKPPYIPHVNSLRESEQISLVCFTDDREQVSGGWETRVREQIFPHPRMSSKWFRMLPHIELSDFDVTIWVDASFQLGNIKEFVNECLVALRSDVTQGYGSALFSNPECKSIFQEAIFSPVMWPEKYKGQPLTEQVAHYREQGLPLQHYMYAGGIHVRDNRVEWVKRLNVLWFAECVRWSYEDQISLPFVLWKLGRSCTVIPGNIYRGNNWLWEKGPDR